MNKYFTITTKTSLEDPQEMCIYSDIDFKRTMNKFFELDRGTGVGGVPVDTILTFYWKDGKKFRQWFAGQDVNLTAC